MNKGHQLQAEQICCELKKVEKEITDLLNAEEKLCDVMRPHNAKPYARACTTLYDARDCVMAAQVFMKTMLSETTGDNKPQNPEL